MASHGRGESLGKQIRDARVARESDVARPGARSRVVAVVHQRHRVRPSGAVRRRCCGRSPTGLSLNLDALLAAAGRVGIAKDAEQYIRETPSAGVLFRRVTNDRLTEGQLKRLLDQVDR